MTKTETFIQKFFDSVREFINRVKKAFKGDKAQMDKASKDAYGVTMEQLEKAEKLWKDMLKATQKVAQDKGDVVGADDGDKTQFSAKKLENSAVTKAEQEYNRRGWAVQNQILTRREYARFEKQVGDKKRGDKYNRSAEGILIIPTGDEQGIENVLVYTDAKHGNPSIEKVVIINGEYETILADIRKTYIMTKNKELKTLLFSMSEKELSQPTRRKIILSIANSEDEKAQTEKMVEMVQKNSIQEIEKIVQNTL
ncbi:MAG: hypothetical protein Q4C14_02940 [Bacillota bacterium]|nr:hypothetical protein [Bacillota bacterium]